MELICRNAPTSPKYCNTQVGKVSLRRQVTSKHLAKLLSAGFTGKSILAQPHPRPSIPAPKLSPSPRQTAHSTTRIGQIVETTYSPATWIMMQYRYSATPFPLETAVSPLPILARLLSADMTSPFICILGKVNHI